MVHLAVKKLFRRPGLCDLSCDSVLSNSSLTLPLNLQSAIFPLAHSVLFHFLWMHIFDHQNKQPFNSALQIFFIVSFCINFQFSVQ